MGRVQTQFQQEMKKMHALRVHIFYNFVALSYQNLLEFDLLFSWLEDRQTGSIVLKQINSALCWRWINQISQQHAHFVQGAGRQISSLHKVKQ